MSYLVEEKPSLDELIHFGVKGMKWGVIREKIGSAVADHQRNRQLNKQFHKEENKKRDATIDAARERFNSGAARQDYLKAKAQYKLDKKTLGTAAARAKLDEVKQRNMTDGEVAQMSKSGRETTLAILAVAGVVALKVGLAVAANSR